MKPKPTYVLIQKFIIACLPVLVFLSGMVSPRSFAQTVISSTSSVTNSESVATVTFNFENTNSFPVIITGISGVLGAYGGQNLELWYKTSAINGAPGTIAVANGWTLGGSATVNGFGNMTSTALQTFFQGMTLTIPANTTYGLAIAGYSGSGTQRVGTLSAPLTLSAGGCNIHMGPTMSYATVAAPPAAPTTTSRGWIGSVTFIPGANCAGAPAAPVISGPATICSAAGFSLTATGYTTAVGVSHQWQYYNTASASWVNIAGATGFPCAITGITTATQYRLVSTCASSTLQSISNTVTVAIGTGMAGGTYTINKNQPATATNFISFGDASAALSCGISGPVVINVTPGSGPYTEAVKFGVIPGASAVNTIKINGNDNILQYFNIAPSYQVLTLAGTQYMKVDHLTVKTLSTSEGWGVLLTQNSKFDTITNCLVDLTSLWACTNGEGAGIAFSSSATTPNVWGDNASYCYVGYNHIKGPDETGGPYYGICMGGSATDSNNVIDHNEIENFYVYGIYAYNTGRLTISNNDIHRKNKLASSSFYGIAAWGNYNYYNYDYRTKMSITGNRLHDPSATTANNSTIFYGITTGNSWWYNDTLDTGDTILVANNAIYNINQNAGSIFGIQFGNGNNSNTYVVHNTIDVSQPSGTGVVYGIWSNYAYWYNVNDDTAHVKNNLVTITGGTTGDKYGFLYYYNTTPTNPNWVLDAQRNNFYVNSSQSGPQYYGSYFGVDYLTKAAFQAAYPALEVGSLSVDPLYLSPATGDLTPLNTSLQGNGVNLLGLVSTDINGHPRSATPTPGAFEFSTDAGVTALVSPIGLFCSSVKQVKVTIANLGQNVINNVQVHWTLNGVAQPPVTYTGILGGIGNPNTTAVVTLGNGLFLPNTTTTIKAWTTMPNGVADAITFNDTLEIAVQPSSSLPVNLGPDAAICTGSSMTLDAGTLGTYFLWDNGWTNQTRNVTAAGTYYVKVTGLDGCIGIDTFKLTLRPLPVVDLGPDQAICLGSTTTLDPGNIGIGYLWDDGSTQQTRIVDTAGIYTVDVTDTFGCVGTDDITIIMKDIPRVDGINAIYGDTATYTFNPINPQFIQNYTWNFGDGSPLKTGQVVQHRYTTNGIYTVDLAVEGECTGLIIHHSRTVDVFDAGGGTGILTPDDADGLLIYPNPARSWITIEVKAGLKMKSVVAGNILGQIVYRAEPDSGAKHRLSTSGLAAGIYTLKIETDKGILMRKFEILK